jgi:hypothetical protein
MELSDTMHGIPMQTSQPNGVRSSDWLDALGWGFMGSSVPLNDGIACLKDWISKLLIDPFEDFVLLTEHISVPKEAISADGQILCNLKVFTKYWILNIGDAINFQARKYRIDADAPHRQTYLVSDKRSRCTHQLSEV